MVDCLLLGNGSLAGSVNSIFELFMLKKIKYGYSISGGYRMFEIPDNYEFYGAVCKEEGGKRYIAVGGVRWITNMMDDCPPPLVLSRKYDESEYKKFDNTDIIDIDKTKDIPDGYMGLMGVPITFLDKWNYEQFDVIGVGVSGAGGVDVFKPIVEGDYKYRRILIRRKK